MCSGFPSPSPTPRRITRERLEAEWHEHVPTEANHRLFLKHPGPTENLLCLSLGGEVFVTWWCSNRPNNGQAREAEEQRGMSPFDAWRPYGRKRSQSLRWTWWHVGLPPLDKDHRFRCSFKSSWPAGLKVHNALYHSPAHLILLLSMSQNTYPFATGQIFFPQATERQLAAEVSQLACIMTCACV
jgi:hypothetical protein